MSRPSGNPARKERPGGAAGAAGLLLLLAVLALPALSPGCVPVDDRRELAQACQEIAAGRYVDAEIRTELCLRNDGRNVDALLLHSLCQLRNSSGALGQSQAVFDLKRAVALAPGRFDARYLLGWGQMRCGRHREALATFEEAMRLLPRSSPYREGLLVCIVGCCLENNLYGKGFSYLQPLRRCARFARSPDLYNVMALLALKRGDERQAVACFLKALRLDPADPVVLQNIAVFFDLYKANAPAARKYYLAALAALRDDAPETRSAIRNRLRRLAAAAGPPPPAAHRTPPGK